MSKDAWHWRNHLSVEGYLALNPPCLSLQSNYYYISNMKIFSRTCTYFPVGVLGMKPSNSREGVARALEMPLSANETPHLYRLFSTPISTPTTTHLIGIPQYGKYTASGTSIGDVSGGIPDSLN
jgi:hypothetical protein